MQFCACITGAITTITQSQTSFNLRCTGWFWNCCTLKGIITIESPSFVECLLFARHDQICFALKSIPWQPFFFFLNSLSQKTDIPYFLGIWWLGRFRQWKAKQKKVECRNGISVRDQVSTLAQPLTRQLFYHKMAPHLGPGPPLSSIVPTVPREGLAPHGCNLVCVIMLSLFYSLLF